LAATEDQVGWLTFEQAAALSAIARTSRVALARDPAMM
jgi:hypothetical protein